MKAIAIYVEGGGDTADQRTELRNGLDNLFGAQKRAAQEKQLRWKMVPCGGRQQTYEAFVNERKNRDAETLCILLVDSEGPIAVETRGKHEENARCRKRHLEVRDGWELSAVPDEHIHLMVQCMEAWIVADANVLASYYGQDFHSPSLPKRANLEDEPKDSLFDKLKSATRKTQKGEYAKIKHASKLLAIISVEKVAKRCPRFKTFASWLEEIVESA
ncbi:MAG: DUF4276 family protein [Pirellulales bacterium]